MPPKVDPELKAFKKAAAAYKKTEEYKERMKAIGNGIAAQGAVNTMLEQQKNT